MKRILISTGLALLGVAVAVAIATAAANLSSQSIGISAEPTTAGEQLAVPVRTTTTARKRAPREAATPKSTPRATRTQPVLGDDDRAGSRDDHVGEDRSGSDDSRSESDDRGGGSDNSGKGSSGSGKNDDD